MKNYIFKFNEEFDGDVFKKGCISTEKPIPYSLDGSPKGIIGNVKLFIDHIGYYVESDIILPNKLGFGFLIKESELTTTTRHIIKCELILVSDYFYYHKAPSQQIAIKKDGSVYSKEFSIILNNNANRTISKST
jgi:hypothetical protein